MHGARVWRCNRGRIASLMFVCEAVSVVLALRARVASRGARRLHRRGDAAPAPHARARACMCVHVRVVEKRCARAMVGWGWEVTRQGRGGRVRLPNTRVSLAFPRKTFCKTLRFSERRPCKTSVRRYIFVKDVDIINN